TRDDPFGRRWDVEVLKPAEARARAADDQQQRRKTQRNDRLESQAAGDRDKVLRAAAQFPDGETRSVIRDASGVRSGRFDAVVAELISAGELEPCLISKGNNRTYKGVRSRTRTHSDAAGQSDCPAAGSKHSDVPM